MLDGVIGTHLALGQLHAVSMYCVLSVAVCVGGHGEESDVLRPCMRSRHLRVRFPTPLLQAVISATALP